MSVTLYFIHIHLRFVADRHWNRFFSEYFDSSLLVTFQKSSVLIFTLTLLLSEDDAAETWEASNKAFIF